MATSIPMHDLRSSFDVIVDQYIDMVDGRLSIASVSSQAHDENDDQHHSSSDTASSLTASDHSDDDSDGPMMRKSYYEPQQDDDLFKDEEDRLIGADDTNHDDDDILIHPKPKRGSRTWLCFTFFAFLLAGWLIWLIVVQNMAPDQASDEDVAAANHIDLADVFSDDFIPKQPKVTWIDDGKESGKIAYVDPKSRHLVARHVDTKQVQVLINATHLTVSKKPLAISKFSFSKDQRYIMLCANASKSLNEPPAYSVYIYDRVRQSLEPLLDPSSTSIGPAVAYAEWSPMSSRVAYVMNNNLYISDLLDHKQITHDGSATVFNGVLDWVYQEELLDQRHALWWSPDGSHLAYLRLDTGAVPEIHLPIYNTSAATSTATATADDDVYPGEMAIRYPKAGSPNPQVMVHVYALDIGLTHVLTSNATVAPSAKANDGFEEIEVQDRLVTDVAWLTAQHDYLAFKQTNRVQDRVVTNVVQLGGGQNRHDAHMWTVDVAAPPADGGWIDQGMNMQFVQQTKGALIFVDWLNNEGFMHMAKIVLKLPSMAAEKQWLTSGQWEVETGSMVVDRQQQTIFYASTERSPLERHIYTLSIADARGSKQCLTCPSDANVYGYYRASFSPDSAYYALHYDGPDVPWTHVNKVGQANVSLALQTNDILRQKLTGVDLPVRRYITINSGGYELNVEEQLPPGFDASQKYPVLFRVYGGPGSQAVTREFSLDWHTFLSSKLQYIVVTVDGRGTGARGRDFRIGVRRQLGKLEVLDQLNAARHWKDLKYVDSARMSIWGWSYGGYLVAKCIEANTDLFKAAVAVAPVTDWRYYDSVYTERYMLTPKLNPEGYHQSAVNNMTGFANTKFLLVHGTADNNGKYQHVTVPQA
ncbi:dipeptidyl peptidase IV N-terminal region-domain-containing protein [Gongronella butleri]|nr:dipeptidyl peptidase IV N-terminal region-domain-containing protein [Gongronella butleri]